MIRPAALEDMAACAAIYDGWVEATGWMPRLHDHADIVRHYREDVFAADTVFVADDDGTIAGYLSLSGDRFISNLYLAAQARGQGVGTRLLARAKTQSPQDLRLWTFVANTGARRFYERQGFGEIRRTDGDNEEGLPDILYGWQGAVQ